AGLSAGSTAGYFPPGTVPSVTASFDSWWRYYPHPLDLSYWVAGAAEVMSNSLPAPTVVALSWSGAGAGQALQVGLPAPAAAGVYLVNADLVDTATSTTIGSTCMTYSVGMPGDTLDLAGLAPGMSYGGPSPERGVQLAGALGTGDMREQLDMAALLPNCSLPEPTTATCGPAGLGNWAAYDPATEQAAEEAKALGVHFEVQFGQDAALDEMLVTQGYWQGDAEAIAEHFATTAPDLGYVEAWNEPNTGPFSPASYVQSVLQPFYGAVQAADAADGRHLQVIGGTVCGMDVGGWWAGIAQAGGFSYMDIAGIHPYPGYDRSFEEEGTPAAIQALKALMARYGAGSMPIWDTEQGWWSDGEEAFYDVGNWAPRAWMWLRSLGITNWDYFIPEGGYAGFGTDYSLIEASNADLYLKPGAIGLMTVSNLLGDRPFVEQVDLGIPHAYGMLFGPPADGSASNDILAVWTDDLDVAGQVSLTSGPGTATLTTTGSLGEPGSLTVSASSPAPVQLSGAPLYLAVPSGDTISVGPAESFGPDLALASAGATAAASSSQGGDNGAADVIRGAADADNGGGIGSTPAWASQPGDPSPWLEVNLASPETVDRVVVSTSSLASVLPGLRDYSVQVETGGAWTTVGAVSNEFFERMEELSFPPIAGVSAVKVEPTGLDYNSQLGGLRPYYWGPGFPAYAVIYSLEVYAPGTSGNLGPPGALGEVATTTTTAGLTPALTATSTTAVPATEATTPLATTPWARPDGSGGTSWPPVAAGEGQPGTTSATTTTSGTPVPSTTTSTAPTTTTSPSAASEAAPGSAPKAPPRTLAGASLLRTKWRSLSYPRRSERGASIPVRVRLAGRSGAPSGAVEVDYGRDRLCRRLLRHGGAVCPASMPAARHQGRRSAQMRGGGVPLVVVYTGDKTYARSAREILVFLSGPKAQPPTRQGRLRLTRVP
ncbi:MAG: discoidin domain-containing protein, partial [Acidimicrobiales bacterium]